MVVDAGHGGYDAGAIGQRKVREKDVTLAIARRLARRLRAHGFKVVMTRRRDRYVPLEQRAAIANGSGADLFVSIHANAHRKRSRRGVETFVPARSGGTARRGALVAARARRRRAEASSQLAKLIQREVCSGVRAHLGPVEDRGVKRAPFQVLVDVRMLAVLVETAFITNAVEERRLASARFQDAVANGIARAVVAFARPARVASRR